CTRQTICVATALTRPPPPSLTPLTLPAPADQSRSRRIGWIDRQRLSGDDDRLGKALFGKAIGSGQRPQIEVIRIEIPCALARRALDLRQAQARFDRSDDGRCHPILQFKNVVQQAVDAVAQMCAPVAASINCPVMRTRLPALRTLPSST